MPNYELRFFDINENIIKKKLSKLGAKISKKRFLMAWDSFDTPNKKDFARVRIEDKNNIVMTVKTDQDSVYVNSYNIKVDNFENASKLLEALGCKKRYRVEKLREVWGLKKKGLNCPKIVFDEFPGLPAYLELECNSEKELFNLVNKLGLESNINQKSHKDISVDGFYKLEYGIREDRPKKLDLTFDNATKIFIPHIKKRKTIFKKQLTSQKKYIKKNK